MVVSRSNATLLRSKGRACLPKSPACALVLLYIRVYLASFRISLCICNLWSAQRCSCPQGRCIFALLVRLPAIQLRSATSIGTRTVKTVCRKSNAQRSGSNFYRSLVFRSYAKNLSAASWSAELGLCNDFFPFPFPIHQDFNMV